MVAKGKIFIKFNYLNYRNLLSSYTFYQHFGAAYFTVLKIIGCQETSSHL